MGRTASPAQAAVTPRKTVKEAEPQPREGHRDTVEAIVVAFILALVVRGFEAQAFVIPTGSMAPTLMGRHKELTCPQCGFVYTVNASHEVEGGSPAPVYSGICTNCRYQASELTEDPQLQGRSDPGHDVPVRSALPSRVRRRPSGGMSSSFATPRSRRSATSSAWSAFPARPSASTMATSTSGAGQPGLPARAQTAQAPAGHADDRPRRPPPAQGPGRQRPMAALAVGTPGGWKIVDPQAEPLPLRGTISRRVG